MTLLLLIIWAIFFSHNDMLLDKKLGEIDYSLGYRHWAPEFLHRTFLASILWVYIEYTYTYLVNKLQK